MEWPDHVYEMPRHSIHAIDVRTQLRAKDPDLEDRRQNPVLKFLLQIVFILP